MVSYPKNPGRDMNLKLVILIFFRLMFSEHEKRELLSKIPSFFFSTDVTREKKSLQRQNYQSHRSQ